MRVAVTGASGFVGVPLVGALRQLGHEVVVVSRGGAGSVRWNPATGEIDLAALQGVNAVVHLAGESLAQRWTAPVQREIVQSRVQGTSVIARAVSQLRPLPSVLVSMSAIGYYGDRGDEILDEASPRGEGFLADTAERWERSADAAREAGVRVVHPRLGVVLHPSGGALRKLLPAYMLGAGGKIGSGRQWMSWVSRTDAVAALIALLSDETLSGPVNLVAPHAERNEDFTRLLAAHVRRPAFAAVPEFAIRLLFGEMGVQTVIASQRVTPKRLLEARFAFRAPTLADAFALEDPR